ncbi:hypothetical protein [Dechloromonas sp. CZR5]|uniref:hypothetical protein n=1 Tax=Dechloromonas sp. CZR5 TaxID=2608630 RepID=UPI001CC48410|nr:hypothetical protein [Dechloromonas sp. CZR5]
MQHVDVNDQQPSAADQYRAAFERLKSNMPVRLPKGTLVTQNNVAREAGTDPSALKKSRFPTLIAEIQQFVSSQEDIRPASARQARIARQNKNRSLKERLAEVSLQRDTLASKLSEADMVILELRGQLDELLKKESKSTVVSLGKTRPPQEI